MPWIELIKGFRWWQGSMSFPYEQVAHRFHGTDLKIIVADSGDGFDPRLAVEDERQKLGLAGIRNRVRAFRGSLQIESIAGEGSRITIRVPVQA